MTIIIPARPDESEVRSLAAAQQLDYPADKMEILLARGRQPSVQRNTALRAALGDIIYFLDDDSRPVPGNLRRAVELFRAPEVKMVGGPNVCPEDAPALEQAFALAMGSWLAFGPSCARYRSTGVIRATSEKELILCNLLARREDVLTHGGFNEALYPNEENALMDELQKAGGRLMYDPALVVHRRPRGTFKAFVKMLLNYGRGRAEQFRLHPTFGSAPNFVPPLFCLFLVALPFLPKLFLWMLALYGVAVLGQALAITPIKRLLWIPWIMSLIFISHVFYGLGFWKGCITQPKPAAASVAAAVQIQKVK